MKQRRRGPTSRSIVIEFAFVALLVGAFYLFLEFDGADALGRFIAERWQP